MTTTAVLGETDTAHALLNLLVKKGLVTPDEAASLERQAAANAAASAQVPAPAAAPAPAATGGYVAAGSTTPGPVPTQTTATSPLSFRIGSANFTPLGFMDFTGVYRSTLNGGDIGSSFGSIAYANTAGGALSETRFSLKNSRLGLRVDSNVADTKVLGYVETDFLGNAATNVNVASNSDVLRMRVFFLDLQHGPWEFLAGQDWSMMTPNRKGLSPIPGDIFYTQNVDTNYQVGLVWGRTPQVRAIYHASPEWTLGFSAENPDQYTGSAVTLPTGFNSADVDTGSSGTATPNVLPDLIGKIAFDTKLGDLPFHADAAALYRYFRINTFAGAVNSDASTSGYGGSVNSILTVAPGLSLVENAFMSKGGGRYLSTGLGPDFIVTPTDASGAYGLQSVYSYAGMLGAEYDVLPTNKLTAYYGIVHYGSKYTQQANGSFVGYGYAGSPTTHNRDIQEYTIGDAQTLWKGASYGDLKLMLQLSYLNRRPWYVAPGSPDNAHLAMFYANLRYDLP